MVQTQNDEESGPLCCCEYLDERGEKNHLLAICCDCQEIDQTCDRFLKGREIEKGSLISIVAVVSDRVRIPTCFGAGARRMDQLMDTTAIPPIIMVPLWIYIGSLHVVATVMSFLLVPAAVLIYYRLILRHRRRTQFFMSWGLVSVVLIYGTFYFCVSDGINMIEFMTVTLLFVFTLVAFFASKHGPGVVKETTNSNLNMFKVVPASSVISENLSSLQRRTCGEENSYISSERWDPQETMSADHDETNHVIGSELQVCSEAANQESRWCDICKLARPERAGHCKICGHCVLRFDHHCVWIDSCVGAGNHRSFLLAALLFVVGGTWGSYVSLSHLCLLELKQLLDCSAVYSDRQSATVFVCIIYTMLAASCVLVLLLQQFHLITHNWTYRERKRAGLSHRRGEALAERDQGFLTNWRHFLLMETKNEPPEQATKLTVV